MPLSPVGRRLLRDEAYQAILRAIVEGELAPGAVLRDVHLAAQVGLSRTPVREALARLSDEGLVESKPNAYTRVTPLTRTDCVEAFTVLRTLHTLAAAEAAPRFTAADADRMRAANARFAAALDAEDVDAALAADDDLHAVVLEVAGNRALTAALDRLTPRIRRLERLRFGAVPGRASVDMHEQIVAALAARDADRAASAVRANWATLGRLIDEAFAPDGETEPHPENPEET